MKKLFTALLAVILIFCASCAQKTDQQMTITVFEAGKADAILIETEKGNVLIDAGLEENKDDLLNALSERGIDSLYALIITHFDKDHVGGADWIVSELNVSHVYTSIQAKESDDTGSFEKALAEAGLNAMVICDKQTFTLGSVSFEINGTAREYEKNTSNNLSLIVKISYGEKTYLFMGDAENERIEEYLSDSSADADFLKVPYHGHYTEKLAELIKAVSPSVSVITNSETEPDADEIAKTSALLNEAGSEVYMTSKGTIKILCTPQSFAVSQ